MSIVAVIPAYRPDRAALTGLITALTESGAEVVVADDGSPCTFDDAFREISHLPIKIVRYSRNMGISRSLNAGLDYARRTGATWLLTVDQDTRLPSGYLDELLHAAGEPAGLWAAPDALRIGAIGAEIIGDASGDLSYPTRSERGFCITDEVFQTGTLWSVHALNEIGGFDERLGIDGVDAAACLALRRAGYAIALAPQLRLEHTLGTSARSMRILGRTVVATGHSPERRESMVRNRLRLAPAEFRESPAQGLRSLRRLAMNTALAVTVEENRWAKAKGSVRGLWPRSSR